MSSSSLLLFYNVEKTGKSNQTQDKNWFKISSNKRAGTLDEEHKGYETYCEGQSDIYDLRFSRR
jgi:hypothetical protein